MLDSRKSRLDFITRLELYWEKGSNYAGNKARFTLGTSFGGAPIEEHERDTGHPASDMRLRSRAPPTTLVPAERPAASPFADSPVNRRVATRNRRGRPRRYFSFPVLSLSRTFPFPRFSFSSNSLAFFSLGTSLSGTRGGMSQVARRLSRREMKIYTATSGRRRDGFGADQKSFFVRTRAGALAAHNKRIDMPQGGHLRS